MWSWKSKTFPLELTNKEEGGDNKKRQSYIPLTLLNSERPKLLTILAFLSAIGLKLTNSF